MELSILQFEAIGIDHARNRHRPKAKVLTIDLASQHGRELLCRLCKDPRVVAAWFGVPCGTASRAREIAHKKGPPPLRTELEPWGRTDVPLDSLQGNGAAKVAQANAIYVTMLEAIAILSSRRIPWAIENPGRSLLWELPEVARLLEEGARDFMYHACMHGGKRLKSQRLRGTLQLDSIVASCDGQHAHLPWKSGDAFFTAEEAEYPQDFCQRVAQAISNDPRVKELVAQLQQSEA